MQLISVLLFCGLAVSSTMQVDVPAPLFQIDESKLVAENCAYTTTIGAPQLPCRRITIALPPGAVVTRVDFQGARVKVGECIIEPALPPLPISHEAAQKHMLELFVKARRQHYSQDKVFPGIFGRIVSKGGLRKYTVIDVECFHFAHNPVSHEVFYSPSILVVIHYELPEPGSERDLYWGKLRNDVTFDNIARACLYNWEQAQQWYETERPYRADGFEIIIPANNAYTVSNLVSYRQSQGYTVNIATVEYIDSVMAGNELAQKIRNYLRQNISRISYVLLVGNITEVPMRYMVPVNNDPDGPWNDPDVAPIPSDMYYAELTDHDSLSWNSDGDIHYGEVYDSLLLPNGDDNPDYHPDIHIGRIPFTNPSNIQDICNKIISFDYNSDMSYKTSSLLAGGMIFFLNENYSNRPRIDGADMMEQILDEEILPRARAVTLYEKAGLDTSYYPCTDSLTNSNMVSYWTSKGVMLEYNHGSYDSYWRKVWAWDDGDGVAESGEMQWLLGLLTTDVFNLDDNFPATSFLRSCLCGKPEANSLGKYLLYRGSSFVINATRVAWVSSLVDQGMGYHFLNRLMKDTLSSEGVIGTAHSLARVDYMITNDFWINLYLFVGYGDPATRQFGRLTGIAETDQWEVRRENWELKAYPNPFRTSTTITLRGASVNRSIGVPVIEVYNIAGQKVRCFSIPNTQFPIPSYVWDGMDEAGNRIAAGVYFLKAKSGNRTIVQKLSIIR